MLSINNSIIIKLLLLVSNDDISWIYMTLSGRDISWIWPLHCVTVKEESLIHSKGYLNDELFVSQVNIFDQVVEAT